MGFSRKEYCSGLPCPSPGDLPKWGIEPRSLALQVDSLQTEPPPGKPHTHTHIHTHIYIYIYISEEKVDSVVCINLTSFTGSPDEYIID